MSAAPVRAFIKICGMTDEFEPWTLRWRRAWMPSGFVLAPSRYGSVTPQQACACWRSRRAAGCIVRGGYPASGRSVAARGDPQRSSGPDVWQSDVEDHCSRACCGQRRIACSHGGVAGAARCAGSAASERDQRASRVLFEGPAQRHRQGGGLDRGASCWPHSIELILAGGLSPAERDVMPSTQVRPFGVDVSSGVEEAPGQQEPGS